MELTEFYSRPCLQSIIKNNLRFDLIIRITLESTMTDPFQKGYKTTANGAIKQTKKPENKRLENRKARKPLLYKNIAIHPFCSR